MSPFKLFTELDVDIIMPMENTIRLYFFLKRKLYNELHNFYSSPTIIWVINPG